MKPLLRLLLVCFLLLALPFQAFAAASMLPHAVEAPLPPCHQQMGRQMSMPHAHAPAALAAPAGKHADHAVQHAKGKCGTCAACCVGVAMAPGLPAMPALAPPSAVSIPFRAGHLPSVDPVLLERPPSFFLA